RQRGRVRGCPFSQRRRQGYSRHAAHRGRDCDGRSGRAAQGQESHRVQISPPERLSPHGRASAETHARENYRNQSRRQNFESEEAEGRGQGVISWLTKKDRAASRTAAIASANGWA